MARHKRERTHLLRMQKVNEEDFKKQIEELKIDIDKLIKINDELRIENKKLFERQSDIDTKYNKILRKLT